MRGSEKLGKSQESDERGAHESCQIQLRRLRVMDRLALTATALVVDPEAFPPIHA